MKYSKQILSEKSKEELIKIILTLQEVKEENPYIVKVDTRKGMIKD